MKHVLVDLDNILKNKKILLLCEDDDSSIDKIIEYLNVEGFYNIDRVNSGDSIKIEKICLNSNTAHFSFSIPDRSLLIDSDEISFFLYRRGVLTKVNDTPLAVSDDKLSRKIWEFTNWEWIVCKDYILSSLQKKPSWGNYFKRTSNKLLYLEIAKSCGFDIPETIISESSDVLNNFLSENVSITKAIGDIMPISIDNAVIDLSTAVVSEIPKTDFFPSLLQSKVEKWIELRVFVSYDEIFAMAIFSQGNEKTQIDFRYYDREKMNRMVPFELPKNIESNIFKFMKESGHDTGSIDLILTHEGNYVFLEINPVGIFEMVSDPCNYYIEKRIAEQIVNRLV
jgi:ATP-GRASP peptide maturase of grasp-with-spasm system